MGSAFTEGYPLEEPKILIPWHIDQQQLVSLLGKRAHRVTRKYYTIPCVSMNGLKHNLGFHFSDDKLVEFELFRDDYSDLRASFDEFQKHLVSVFGAPISESKGYEDFPKFEWSFHKFHVVHLVMLRFGPEEHVRIQNFV